MDILFEDNNIVVCVKPRGVLSQLGDSENMIDLLNSRFAQNGEAVQAFPVHRLDRETAGVMVFAKNPCSAAVLSKQITENKFKKHYYAVIKGVPEQKCGIFEDLLFRDKVKNKSFVVDRMRNGVKDAALEYRILAESSGFALADILLHTGRTHQIRVQFSSRSLPLYGDRKYGGCAGGLALFAYRLEFFNPSDGKKLDFSALPDKSTPPWNLFGLYF